jgi:periplasmic divalent cation tolerance protein
VGDIVTVEVNCPDEGVAARIAEALVARRLAASANVRAPVESIYHWKGRVERSREVPLTLKTRAAHVPAVAAAIRALHPYETPAILVRAVEPATDEVRAWLLGETEGGA